MLSTQIGNVNVHFEPLIAVAILFGAILLFHIIRTIILEIKCNQISKDILAGNYDDIIKSGEKVLKIYKFIVFSTAFVTCLSKFVIYKRFSYPYTRLQ